MNKKIGLMLILALVFSTAGCTKQVDKSQESQSASTPENATESSSNAESTTTEAKVDYSNEALLKEALKEMIAKSVNLEGIQYENVVTYQGVETVQKIWQAKGKMKISTTVEGNESITIVTEKDTITYDLATKQGVAYSDGPQEDEEEMPNITEDEIGNYKFISEETIDGEPCIVVSEASSDSSTSKIWMSKNYGIMMKAEMKDTASNVGMTLSIRNLKTFKPDSHFFEVPADIKITKM